MAIPIDVSDYFGKGKRRLIEVTPSSGYLLTLKYDDNELRLYNLSGKLTGVMSVLVDEAKFNEVFIDDSGNIAWDIDKNIDSDVVFSNRIDLSSDNAYIYGERLQ